MLQPTVAAIRNSTGCLNIHILFYEYNQREFRILAKNWQNCAIFALDPSPVLFEDDETPRTEAVTKDDREHSQWYDRNTMWLSSK